MRFIRMKQVMEMTSLSRAAIFRYIEQERFPRSVSLGCRTTAWLESEVKYWMCDVLGRTNIYVLMGCRQFSHRVQMGAKSVKWHLQDIEA
ncbi:AlpA family transcriptional regulator [Vibrio splendidus]|uniref:AlpA family transcriptional regulator n=1 Tax=Vibrio splendidus TaxID=29497 RepID=UPI00223696C4|nr:AlpA family transcriptional regulator [Vibrio splendidus]MCW4444204.1 AlpA family transcriptional regulator [Vibrio splendidus]